ncbi:periplasmic binding fold domain-containing protein (plasmid) [Rhizobium sp. NXC24]|nr:periplasmic binding fold domain-containing protein [Rhizobium sp. NXC24]
MGTANISVARAIRADILPCRPAFLGHELTRNAAAFLPEDLMSIVLDQSPKLQVRLAVNLILRHFELHHTSSLHLRWIRTFPSISMGRRTSQVLFHSDRSIEADCAGR